MRHDVHPAGIGKYSRYKQYEQSIRCAFHVLDALMFEAKDCHGCNKGCRAVGVCFQGQDPAKWHVMRLQEVVLVEDVGIDFGYLLTEFPWFDVRIDQAEATPYQGDRELS